MFSKIIKFCKFEYNFKSIKKMKITYYGHSCFEIETSKVKLLVDPFITANPLAKNIDVSQIKPEFILLTHAHGDHTLDAEAIAKQSDATIIANAEIATHYSKLGIKAHGMNIGGRFNFEFGIVKMVSAEHSSSFPDGTYGGNPTGFMLSIDNRVIYIAGDTGLTADMKSLPFIFGYIDVAILPIGGNYTMGLHDAVVASKFIKSSKIIGCHFNTFPEIQIDTEEAVKRFLEEEKKLIIIPIGDSITI